MFIDIFMAFSQLRSKRKVTGGLYKYWRKKKLRDLGSNPTHTKLGERKLKQIKVTGGNIKNFLISINMANVYDTQTKKYQKLKIETVVDNPADKNLVKRNIITKGTIIKTEKGNARVTSRPSQDGIINAVLLK